jgi:hypothetical protein
MMSNRPQAAASATHLANGARAVLQPVRSNPVCQRVESSGVVVAPPSMKVDQVPVQSRRNRRFGSNEVPPTRDTHGQPRRFGRGKHAARQLRLELPGVGYERGSIDPPSLIVGVVDELPAVDAICNRQVWPERSAQLPGTNLILTQVRALVAGNQRVELQPKAQGTVNRRGVQHPSSVPIASLLGPVLPR